MTVQYFGWLEVLHGKKLNEGELLSGFRSDCFCSNWWEQGMRLVEPLTECMQMQCPFLVCKSICLPKTWLVGWGRSSTIFCLASCFVNLLTKFLQPGPRSPSPNFLRGGSYVNPWFFLWDSSCIYDNWVASYFMEIE